MLSQIENPHSNPATLILISLHGLEYLARVDGRMDPENLYTELGFWKLTDDQAEYIDRYVHHIQDRTLECFGNSPLAHLGSWQQCLTSRMAPNKKAAKKSKPSDNKTAKND